MVRMFLLFLSVLFVLGTIFWMYEMPREWEPKITFVGGLIGFIAMLFKTPKKKNSRESEPEEIESQEDIIGADKGITKEPSIGQVASPGTAEMAGSEISISPSVFISYAHDSPAHKKRALDLADHLNSMGIDCWIDRYVEDNPPKMGWPLWMDERIRISNYILMICSERYLARIQGKEEKSKGLGVKFESILIVQALYENDSLNDRIIPVVFSLEDKKYIPSMFKAFTWYSISEGVSNQENEQFLKLYRRLTNQPEIIKPPVGKIKELAKEKIQIIEEQRKLEQEIPQLIKFRSDMKQGAKILQAYVSLPLTKRFEIARKLGLLEPGEDPNRPASDKTSMIVLVRAQEKKMLAELWNLLFNESIDPNPFKQ